MPWLGEDMSTKDPGLSLVQWMNMQQNSSPNYLNPLSGSIPGSIFSGSDLSRQLGAPPPPPPQILTHGASMVQPPQQLTDPNQSQQMFRQNLINQNQNQNQIQNHHLYRNLQSPQTQFHDTQQLQIPDNQISIQLLQKLHQQQQSLLAQQSVSLPQQQDEQKPLIDVHVPVPQSFSRSMSTSQTMDAHTPPLSKNNSQPNLRFSGHKFSGPNQISTGGGGQSGITDDIPSCSTSPSTNNFQTMVTGVETLSTNVNFGKVSPPVNAVNIPKGQNPSFLAPITYLNNIGGPQMDFLDSSSSATSICAPQSDLHPQPLRTTIQDDSRTDIPFGGGNMVGMPSMIVDPLTTKGMVGSSKDFESNVSPGGMILYENNNNPSKDAQPELSSSMVSQSFGVPDITFNSIDSTINDGGLLNGGVWAPPPQPFQRMRTYTKV